MTTILTSDWSRTGARRTCTTWRTTRGPAAATTSAPSRSAANHSTASTHVTTVLTSDWLQEFLLKYSNLIADAKAMQCSECECSVLLLDFKEMCTRDRADGMIWV